MMCKRIIQLVATWLLIAGIKGQADNDEEGLVYNEVKEEYLRQELKMLDKVTSYYVKRNEKSSTSRSLRKDTCYDENMISFLYTTYLTFWTTVTLKTYSVFKSCIYGEEPETQFDFYIKEMTFTFEKLKKAIKKYGKRGNKSETKNAVTDVNSSRCFTDKKVANIITHLSLDIVSDEDTLKKKKLDKYSSDNGIIIRSSYLANLIEELKKRDYNTVFLSCPFTRKLFCKTFLYHHGNYSYGSIFRTIRREFEKYKPIEFYSNENEWQEIINTLNKMFKKVNQNADTDSRIFEILALAVTRYKINVSKCMNVELFFIYYMLDINKAEIFEDIFHWPTRSWIPSTWKNSSEVWNIVQNTLMNTSEAKISSGERIKNVITSLRNIIEAEITTLHE